MSGEEVHVGDALLFLGAFHRVSGFSDYDTTPLLGFNLNGSRVAHSGDSWTMTLLAGQPYEVLA